MTIHMEDLLNSIMESFDRIDYIKAADIPNIDLYMDQVTTLMESRLKNSTRYPDQDKILTKTMINNYTKNHLLPPPLKKKYSREHLAYLLIICSLKQVMPIPKIKELIDLKLKSCTPQDLLNNFSDLYKVTFEGVLENSTSYIDKSKDSLLDASIFLAMASSQSRFISEAILKMQKEN